MEDNSDSYRRAAELVYVQMREMSEFALKMQGEYGRWLVSSLLFLHGAAIGGLLFKVSNGNLPPYFDALWWFLSGILLALVAGFSAWWNFTFVAEQYYEWADVRMLTDSECWPKPGPNYAVKVTLWIAVIAGVLSAGCLIGGAAHVACSWQ